MRGSFVLAREKECRSDNTGATGQRTSVRQVLGRDTVRTGRSSFFNRNGMFFDKGETFSGVPYDTGLQAVTRLIRLFPDNTPLAHVALRWILMREEVGCIIPGASSPEQVRTNLEAAGFPRS